MNTCLREKLGEVNEIMQAQEKLASIGSNNLKELEQANTKLQEQLQEKEKENEGLLSQLTGSKLMSTYDDEMISESSSHQSFPQNDSSILGWLRNSSGNSIYNTHSYHMYAIFVTTSINSSNPWKYAHRWLAAIASLTITIWQLLILFFLILDFESSPVSFGADMTSDAEPCSRFHIELKFNYIFVLFLFAVVLSGDIEETAIEQTLLNNRASQIASQRRLMPIQAQLVSFSLRIQRLTFPWYVGTAVFFALVAESPSVPYTLLNLITIGLVTVVDKMVAIFFLTHEQRASTNQLMPDFQPHHKNVTVSFFWSRIFGLAATTVIFSLTEVLEHGLNNSCEFFLSETLSLVIFIGFLPVFTIFVPSLVNLNFNRREQTRRQKISYALVDFIRNVAAYCFVICMTLIVMEISLGEDASGLHGLHLENVWFWVVACLLVITIVLYCILYWYVQPMPHAILYD